MVKTLIFILSSGMVLIGVSKLDTNAFLGIGLIIIGAAVLLAVCSSILDTKKGY